MICLPWSSVTTAQAFDHAVNVAATLAEDLLVAGHAVGLVAPQVTREAARGARQRAALLTELALLEPHGTAPLPLWTGRGALVAVVAEGVEPPRHAHIVVYAAQCGDGLEEHLQREPVDAGMPVTTERP